MHYPPHPLSLYKYLFDYCSILLNSLLALPLGTFYLFQPRCADFNFAYHDSHVLRIGDDSHNVTFTLGAQLFK